MHYSKGLGDFVSARARIVISLGETMASASSTLSKLVFLSLLFAALFLAPLHAADTYWQHDPATPADWFDPLNWSAGLPTSSDTSYIQNGGTVVIANGTAFSRDFNIAYAAATSGSVDQTGGSLTGHQLFVGNTGTGSFTQSGGFVLFPSSSNDDEIYLGYASGSTGTYNLSGTGSVVTKELWVGYGGLGVFNQTGGTCDALYTQYGSLYVGCSPQDNKYTLGGTGQLSAGVIWVGAFNTGTHGTLIQTGGNCTSSTLNLCYDPNSVGTYTQSGGTNTTGEIWLACSQTGSVGTYNLSYGDLIAVGTEHIGTSHGFGTFNQTGGSNTTPRIELGSRGTFNLDGGTLSCPFIWMGISGPGGRFNQTGGICTVSDLIAVDNINPGPIYTLSGTGQLNVKTIQLGRTSSCAGTFNQTGGSNTVTNTLQLGVVTGSTGTYNLSGPASVLSTPSLVVGDAGTGKFTQFAGSHTVAGPLTLGYASTGNGAYEISGGSLSATDLVVGRDSGSSHGTGLLKVTNATASITVSHALHLGQNSSLDLVPGSAIHMTGAAFENQSTDPAKLAGLANLALLYDGHTGQTDPFELAGADLGSDMAGFVNNFALGAMTLEDKAIVKLVDDFNNLHRNAVGGSDEALYLSSLTMLPGSTLDLNGFHLYVANLDLQGGSIINGSLISLPVPEPASLLLLASASVALFGLRRQRP